MALKLKPKAGASAPAATPAPKKLGKTLKPATKQADDEDEPFPAEPVMAKKGRPSGGEKDRSISSPPVLHGKILRIGNSAALLSEIEYMNVRLVQNDVFETQLWFKSGKSAIGRHCSRDQAYDDMQFILDAINALE